MVKVKQKRDSSAAVSFVCLFTHLFYTDRQTKTKTCPLAYNLLHIYIDQTYTNKKK